MIKNSNIYTKSGIQLLACLTLLTIGVVTAQAAGSDLPWEAPLQSILESITGPVARIIAVMVITLTGLTLAFGETSGDLGGLFKSYSGYLSLLQPPVFPELFQLCRRGGRLMEGYVIPLHRSLTENIMLGGAPRNVAIVIGTLAAAVGLGLQLWILGAVIWLIGHSAAVLAAKYDPQFMDVTIRHIRYKQFLEA